jgi:dethiobiotin synthetase
MKTLAITGTNTDIGKTYVACGIVRELKCRGIDVGVFKPFCSGSREDVEKLISASGVKDTIEEVNPFFFEPPLAPYHAIKLNGGDIDIGKCIAAFDVLRQKHDLMIVEGAGGIMVPIMETQEGIYSFLDLFRDLASDIIIVTSRDLGTINHSWLTSKTCKEAGLNVQGFVFNDTKPVEEKEPAASNPEIIEYCSGTPVLGIVKHDNPETRWDTIVDKILNEKNYE